MSSLNLKADFQKDNENEKDEVVSKYSDFSSSVYSFEKTTVNLIGAVSYPPYVSLYSLGMYIISLLVL